MISRLSFNVGLRELVSVFEIKINVVRKFELAFAKKFKAVDAVAFPYGRSAQWAFLKALGINSSEIIMPAYTCSVVSHAINLSGNTPIFIDIQLDDYNMDLAELERKINDKTRVIIATHTYGYPENLSLLKDIIKRAETKYSNKIWLMNDCCHAFDAHHNGQQIGTTGDVAVYALNISKLMTSVFGGMLTFQDAALASEVRKWRDTHFKKATLGKSLKRRMYFLLAYFAFKEPLYRIVWYIINRTNLLKSLTDTYHLDDKIHFPPDYLSHMSNFEASIGLVQLKKYDENIAERRKIAFELDTICKEDLNIAPAPRTNGCTYSHYTILYENKKELIRLFASHGIELGELIQYVIPHLKSYGSRLNEFQNAKFLSDHAINIPLKRGTIRQIRNISRKQLEK